MVQGSTPAYGSGEIREGRRPIASIVRTCRPHLENLENRLNPSGDLGFGATLPIIQLEVEAPRLAEVSWPLPAQPWLSPLGQHIAVPIEGSASADAIAHVFAASPDPLAMPPERAQPDFAAAVDLIAANVARVQSNGIAAGEDGGEEDGESGTEQGNRGYILAEAAAPTSTLQEQQTQRANRWAALLGIFVGTSQKQPARPRSGLLRPARRPEFTFDENLSSAATRAPPDWRRRIPRLRMIAGGADDWVCPVFVCQACFGSRRCKFSAGRGDRNREARPGCPPRGGI